MAAIEIDDIHGCAQLLAEIAKHCHMIDVRIRLDGKYYWFEGDYLKHILPHIKYNRIDKEVDCKLENHEQYDD